MRVMFFNPVTVEETPDFDSPQSQHGPVVDPRFDVLKGQVFSLYHCNTNFSINEDFVLKMSYVPGVELVKPMTKYRLAMGIAQGFNHSTVIASVKKQCVDEPNSLIGFDKIKGLKEPFKSKVDNLELSSAPFKLAYILPNGKAEYYNTANADAVFMNKCHTFSIMRKSYGGVLIVLMGGNCKDSATEETEIYPYL